MASVEVVPAVTLSVAGELVMLKPPLLVVVVVDTVMVSVLEAAELFVSPE